MTKKKTTKKKNAATSPTEVVSVVSSNVVEPTPKKSLLPKDLFREIEKLKLRVDELEKKLN